MILGLDVSTNLGYVSMDSEGNVLASGEIFVPPDEEGFRARRYAHYLDKLDLLDIEYDHSLVVTEQLVATKYGGALVVAELGAVVREFYRKIDVPVLEVAPSMLKKWVSGKGTANKSQMLMHVFKRWRWESPTDNIGDAYALAQFGRQFAYRNTREKRTQEFIDKILENQLFLKRVVF